MMDQSYLDVEGKEKTIRRFLDDATLGPSIEAAVKDPMTKSVKLVRAGRNEPCPCGSGVKFKKCCLWKVNCGVEILGDDNGKEEKS